jgi:hypothetical protein
MRRVTSWAHRAGSLTPFSIDARACVRPCWPLFCCLYFPLRIAHFFSRRSWRTSLLVEELSQRDADATARVESLDDFLSSAIVKIREHSIHSHRHRAAARDRAEIERIVGVRLKDCARQVANEISLAASRGSASEVGIRFE